MEGEFTEIRKFNKELELLARKMHRTFWDKNNRRQLLSGDKEAIKNDIKALIRRHS